MNQPYGAQPGDWDHFDLILGLGEDLLPVVSNPNATISEHSKMAALGKTPSVYNWQHRVAGFKDWTSHRATSKDIETWAKENDYGICLQARSVRALDVDVDDPHLADEIVKSITGTRRLPMRKRGNASKVLFAFTLEGDYTKRSFKCATGIVEFLATGQQFIAVGTHPSGARYEWEGGLPVAFPVLTPEEFESLWAALVAKFAVEEPNESKATSKKETLSSAVANDPIAARLEELGLVRSTERDGRIHITCPFEEEHTGDSAESSTTYWPPHTGGYELGNFRCLHAHCDHRTRNDYLEALGLVDDPADDFECFDIDEEKPGVTASTRFPIYRAAEFSQGAPMGWWIKNFLPKGELGVIYGPPGSGKSFFILDAAIAMARGLETWNGKKVNKARVCYVAAEGAGGFRNRLQAYAKAHELNMEDIPLLVMPSTPNLMRAQDVADMVAAIEEAGGADVIIYDTLARGTIGADENSAKDMGIAIGNCRKLHDKTKATVVLVHHSGKDPTKGARGSNAILGAVDVEIEVSRVDSNRTATISKMKDGEDGEQFGFTLKTIPIGMDEDNDVISSCVVEHGEVVVAGGGRRKMKDNEQRVWTALLDLQQPDGSLPSVEAVITAAADTMAFDSGSGKRDRRRELMGKALDGVCNLGKARITNGAVEVIAS